MLVALQGMRGERPARHARQLDYLEAQVCENFKVWRGVLEPWIPPLLRQAVVNASPIQSVYRYKDAPYWLHWPEDVDVVRAPIAGVSRLYWTGETGYIPLLNGDFETGVFSPYWTTFSSNVSISSAQVHSGSYSARVEGDGVNNVWLDHGTVAKVRPGDKITYTGYAMRDEASLPDPDASFYIDWRDSGGGNISYTNDVPDNAVSGWQKLVATGTAPAGAAYFRVGFRGQVGGIGAWFVDDFSVTRSDLAPGPRMGSLDTIAGVTALTTPAPASQNFVLVTDVSAFRAEDDISIELDAGGTHDTTITTIQASLNRLNLSVALPSQASAGNLASIANNQGYPLASYLLGVPAPASAPTTAIDTTANQGDVIALTGSLAEQTGNPTTTANTVSIDLTNVDGNGDLIYFEIDAGFTGQIVTTQQQTVRIQVFRDPAVDNELIFETEFTQTFQGIVADSNPPGTPGGSSSLYWQIIQAQILGQTEVDASASRFLNFTYAAADGAQTYRLTVTQGFTAEAANPNWTYNLRLSARTALGIQLDDASGLDEGDTVQLSGNEGSGSVADLNKGTLTITRVEGNVIYVTSPIFGSLTTAGKWAQVWDDADLEARTYVLTYVASLDGKDMEGPPSPPSTILDVGDNQIVTVTGFVDPTTLGDGRPYSAIRIYRVATGSLEEIYQFVGEVAVDATSFSDTIRGTDLDEELPSQYTSNGKLIRWEPPPATMKGIIELPNSQLAAYDGNELMFCEPDQPHAWPPAYRHTMHDGIVGIGAFGASVFVGTQGRPTIVTGVDPIAVVEEHVEVVFPCASKRGIVDMGYAILYPSKRGLVMVAQGTADLVTADLFTDNQWEAMNPASFVAAKYGNRYMWFYDDGLGKSDSVGGYILDPKNPLATLSRLTLSVTEVWSDPRTDGLYLVAVNSAGNEEIVEWEGDIGGIPWRGRWRSKEFTARYPVALNCVKVDAEVYPVTVTVYMDGAVYDSVDVTSENIERLSDALGEGRKWEIEVEGNTEIQAVYAASTVRELSQYLSGVA